MMNDLQKRSLRKALQTRPYLVPLGKRLASIGGDTPVIWNEDELTSELFVAMLLLFGRVSSGKDARLQRMDGSGCHANSIKLALKDLNRYHRDWVLRYRPLAAGGRTVGCGTARRTRSSRQLSCAASILVLRKRLAKASSPRNSTSRRAADKSLQDRG